MVLKTFRKTYSIFSKNMVFNFWKKKHMVLKRQGLKKTWSKKTWSQKNMILNKAI